MTKTKLILIEGIPGSGKSTTAQLTYDILKEMNIGSKLFLEGNLEHPADYDTVSYFSKDEFTDLKANFKEFESLLLSIAVEQENGYLIPRYKIGDSKLPDELSSTLWNHDLYELPLELHIELITAKWEQFRDMALNSEETYIFECCFIQNPVTTGMVKYDASDEVVMNYIKRLADIIEPLNPVLIYVDQKDLSYSFTKAVQERPKDWSEGFMNYYNHQGYGKRCGAEGLEGTIAVLKARSELEAKIFEALKMEKYKIDNSEFDLESYKVEIMGIVK
ncbi:hypothetical protein ACFSO7_03485 [Bacillus sp. CGMCC 1.16607]|uniref:hypothetical protein n=1 Tax=Bacillus sp. CGMCC 1.16607 TaxID=3351842 RepID=UPI00363CDDF5